MVWGIDKTRMAVIVLIIEAGDGYMGVHYTMLVTLYTFEIFRNEKLERKKKEMD